MEELEVPLDSRVADAFARFLPRARIQVRPVAELAAADALPWNLVDRHRVVAPGFAGPLDARQPILEADVQLRPARRRRHQILGLARGLGEVEIAVAQLK